MSKFEFGGPVGVTIIMIWSHLLLYYFWYCITFNQGNLVYPTTFSEIFEIGDQIKSAIATHACFRIDIFFIYTAFIFTQFVLASFMPGIKTYGLPLEKNKDKKLLYFCNAYSCYYLTISLIILLNYFGVFRLSFIYDNLGYFLTSAVIFSNIAVLILHFLAVLTKKAERMTGYFIYDLFMGAYLNPRIGFLDIKMIAEVRVSWLLFQILALSSLCKQYEEKGYISPEMICINIAYWFYSNACAKGEHYIPTTWDMFYEKFGWMLNFWNFAGVPFLYSLQANFIFIRDIHLPWTRLFCIFFVNCIAYYFWDTANFHKNDYRMRERGIDMHRKAFPVLPWSKLPDPCNIFKTPYGTLLVDGWYKYARKLHYSSDIVMTFCWGSYCGYESFMPFYYFFFFTGMIIHRWQRDEKKCAQKYKEYWNEYKKLVPYVFIPKVF